MYNQIPRRNKLFESQPQVLFLKYPLRKLKSTKKFFINLFFRVNQRYYTINLKTNTFLIFFTREFLENEVTFWIKIKKNLNLPLLFLGEHQTTCKFIKKKSTHPLVQCYNLVHCDMHHMFGLTPSPPFLEHLHHICSSQGCVTAPLFWLGVIGVFVRKVVLY